MSFRSHCNVTAQVNVYELGSLSTRRFCQHEVSSRGETGSRPASLT